MSGSLNQVTLIGNLGADPELVGDSADPIGARLSLATKETWTDKAGHRQERTEWHRITVFGNRGRACYEHLRKGSMVHVRGRIETRKYEHEGQTRYSTEIVANGVTFLGGKPRFDATTIREDGSTDTLREPGEDRDEPRPPLERREGDRPANRPAWDRKR